MSQTNIDSLKSIWANTSMPDTTRLDALYQMMLGDFSSYPDSIIHYGGIMLEFAKEKNELEFVGMAHTKLGYAHSTNGTHSEAIDHAFKALEIAENLEDEHGQSACFVLIGNIYASQGQFEDALEYFEKSQKMDEQLGDLGGQASSLGNMAGCYYFMGDLKKSIEYDKKSLAIAEKIDDPMTVSVALNNIGMTYVQLEQYSDALDYFEKSLEIAEQINDEQGVIVGLQSISRAYMALEEYDEALHYANESLDRAKQINYLFRIEEGYRLLYLIHEETNNVAAAYDAYKLYRDIGDSIQNEQNLKSILEQEAKYEYDKKTLADSLEFATAQELSQMEVTVERQRKERSQLFLVASLVVLVMVLFILYVVIKRNKTIRQQRAVIAKKNDENELLLKEIHHRVKNNLQIISSLLDLQSRAVGDESTLEVLRDGQSRVQAMSLIHQRLYQSDHLDDVEFDAYVKDLFEELQKSFASNNVDLQIESEAIKLDIDVIIPLGLIMNELITNSFKHAFDNEKIGKINIVLSPDESKSGAFILNYRDNGNGLPSHIDFSTNKSLGLRLVKRLSLQLFGEAQYKDNMFHITFQV